MRLILASGSPRRAELLHQIGLEFEVISSNVDEGQEPTFPLQDWVTQLARVKAQSIEAGADNIILAADTIVVLEEQVLGKPANEQKAVEMLELLAGRSHDVMTGICILHKTADSETGEITIYQDVEVTKVYFRQLSSQEIRSYAASGEPLDKAGAYGIQGLGALLVEKIEGCYYNVVGLPLVKTMCLLRKCGVTILGDR